MARRFRAGTRVRDRKVRGEGEVRGKGSESSNAFLFFHEKVSAPDIQPGERRTTA